MRVGTGEGERTRGGRGGSNGIIRSFGWRDETDVYVNLMKIRKRGNRGKWVRDFLS